MWREKKKRSSIKKHFCRIKKNFLCRCGHSEQGQETKEGRKQARKEGRNKEGKEGRKEGRKQREEGRNEGGREGRKEGRKEREEGKKAQKNTGTKVGSKQGRREGGKEGRKERLNPKTIKRIVACRDCFISLSTVFKPPTPEPLPLALKLILASIGFSTAVTKSKKFSGVWEFHIAS